MALPGRRIQVEGSFRSPAPTEPVSAGFLIEKVVQLIPSKLIWKPPFSCGRWGVIGEPEVGPAALYGGDIAGVAGQVELHVLEDVEGAVGQRGAGQGHYLGFGDGAGEGDREGQSAIYVGAVLIAGAAWCRSETRSG